VAQRLRDDEVYRTAMKSYRVFVFEMGHVNAVVTFETASDEAALNEAKMHFPEEQRELWEADRFVARLNPETQTGYAIARLDHQT
jgi:hypothetical protein